MFNERPKSLHVAALDTQPIVAMAAAQHSNIADGLYSLEQFSRDLQATYRIVAREVLAEVTNTKSMLAALSKDDPRSYVEAGSNQLFHLRRFVAELFSYRNPQNQLLRLGSIEELDKMLSECESRLAELESFGDSLDSGVIASVDYVLNTALDLIVNRVLLPAVDHLTELGVFAHGLDRNLGMLIKDFSDVDTVLDMLGFNRLDWGLISRGWIDRQLKTHKFPHHQPAPDNRYWVHPIPYVLIRGGGSVMHFYRSGSEGRLHSKISVGFGGHLDLQDYLTVQNLRPDSPVEFSSVVVPGMLRELSEELYPGFARLLADKDPAAVLHFVGFIVSPRPHPLSPMHHEQNGVDNDHLGLVFSVNRKTPEDLSLVKYYSDSHQQSLRGDDDNGETPEIQHLYVEPLTAIPQERLEGWSKRSSSYLSLAALLEGRDES